MSLLKLRNPLMMTILNPLTMSDEFWNQPEQKKAYPRLKQMWDSMNKDPRMISHANLKSMRDNRTLKLCYVMDPWVPEMIKEMINHHMGICNDFQIYEFKVKILADDMHRVLASTLYGPHFLNDYHTLEILDFNADWVFSNRMYLTDFNYGKCWRLYEP